MKELRLDDLSQITQLGSSHYEPRSRHPNHALEQYGTD